MPFNMAFDLSLGISPSTIVASSIVTVIECYRPRRDCLQFYVPMESAKKNPIKYDDVRTRCVLQRHQQEAISAAVANMDRSNRTQASQVPSYSNTTMTN